MPDPLGLDLRIETPENVVLTYQLAGPALRALAYLVDFAFRLMILIAALIVMSVLAFFWSGPVLTVAELPLGWFDLGFIGMQLWALVELLLSAWRLYRLLA